MHRRPPNVFGRMLVSSRSLAEYRRMFDLTDADLAGRVLDCPGGASSFTAEVSALGGTALAVDPEYTRQAEDLREHALAEITRGYTYHQGHPDEYVWTFFTDPGHYLRVRREAAARFAADFRDHRDRYRAASLPDLPFPDGHFDLAVTSHLLFSYLDRLDEDFHIAAMLELTRVAKQARIFPLVPSGRSTNPHLPDMLRRLRAAGLDAEVRAVDYEFQRGGHEVLTIARRETG